MTELFVFTVSPLELFVRGTVMYWFLFVLFRFVMRRDLGSMGVADILIIVIVADAAQNAMSGGYESVSDGMLLVGTLLGWNLFLDFLGYRFAVIDRFLEAPALPLVRNGQLIRRNMRKQFITDKDIFAKLREHGIDSPVSVKAMYLEANGEVSVLKFSGKDESGKRRAPQT